MLFFCGPAAIFYLIVVFSLSYITKTLALPKQTGFLLLMGANVCAIAGALAGGMLSDRIGRRKALAIGSIATLAMLFVYFPILDTKSFAADAGGDGPVPRLHPVPERHPAGGVRRGVPDQRALLRLGARVHRRQPGRRQSDAGARRVAAVDRQRLTVGCRRGVRRVQRHLADRDR